MRDVRDPLAALIWAAIAELVMVPTKAAMRSSVRVYLQILQQLADRRTEAGSSDAVEVLSVLRIRQPLLEPVLDLCGSRSGAAADPSRLDARLAALYGLAVQELCKYLSRAGSARVRGSRLEDLQRMYLEVVEAGDAVPVGAWPEVVDCLALDCWPEEKMNRAFGCIIDTVCRSPRDRGAPLVKLLHTLGPRLAKLPADQLESLMRCQQFFECHGARYRSVLEPVGLAGNGATPRNGRVWERYDVHCRVQCTLANGEQCRQSGCVTREMSMRGFYAPECREPANAVLRSVRLRIPKKRHRSHVRVEVSQCRVVATHASEQLAGRGVLIDHIGDGQGDRLYAAMKELAGRRD